MKILRKLLFPFSLLYYILTSIRNILYNTGVLKSRSYSKPVIVVGNLNTGGTGKSPMIILLIEALLKQHKLAVLSRGYKRKTKGYIALSSSHTAEEVGDEPLQFKTSFPDLNVSVCADRRYGISQLIEDADVILLDDAFQHRKVKASYAILLTSYGDLFSEDYILPVGNLREARVGAKRADCIVVTKCPADIAEKEKTQIRKQLSAYSSKPVYFASIAYAEEVRDIKTSEPIASFQTKPFTLVTGIANPKPLLEHLDSLKLKYTHLAYPDHHAFTEKELENLQELDRILTTEKDFMRLQGKVKAVPLHYLPIKTVIQGEHKAFVEAIEVHISTYAS